MPELTPFQEFYETKFFAHAERYPQCRDQAELLELARQAWNDMDEATAERWKARYEQRQLAPMLERDESTRGRGREWQRERERERDRERELEMERERERERERGREVEMEMEQPTGSGFTAVNG